MQKPTTARFTSYSGILPYDGMIVVLIAAGRCRVSLYHITITRTGASDAPQCFRVETTLIQSVNWTDLEPQARAELRARGEILRPGAIYEASESLGAQARFSLPVEG